MVEPIFLDTSYAIALLNTTDRHHRAAARWARTLAATRPPVVTSEAILLEIGNNFAKPAQWKRARAFIEGLRRAPNVTVVAFDGDLFARGWSLRCSYEDKAWGLVDCTSFEVMRDAGSTAALTADQHFRQFGFRTLLLE